MDEFKKKLKTRQVLLACGLLLCCSTIMLTRNMVENISAWEHVRGFILGFQAGLVLGLVGTSIFFLVKYTRIMKDPARLNALYISETDERILLIQQKSGSLGMNIVMYGLVLGTIVAGNINDMVFFTLLGVSLFVMLVRGLLKLYYRKKY